MARFTVEERCLIGGLIRRPGDVVEYEGPPLRYLTPLDPPKPVAEAPKVVQEPVAEQPVKRKRGRPRKHPLPTN